MTTMQCKASEIEMQTQPPPQYNAQPQPSIVVLQPPTQPQANQPQSFQAPLSLGKDPANIRCPHCHQQVQTSVKRTNTSKTHLWMFGLCICACWPCCIIPYFCDACRGAVHSCPVCKVDLGVGRE